MGVGKNIVNDIAEGESYIGLENVDGENGEYVGTTDKESVSSTTCISSRNPVRLT